MKKKEKPKSRRFSRGLKQPLFYREIVADPRNNVEYEIEDLGVEGFKIFEGYRRRTRLSATQAWEVYVKAISKSLVIDPPLKEEEVEKLIPRYMIPTLGRRIIEISGYASREEIRDFLTPPSKEE